MKLEAQQMATVRFENKRVNMSKLSQFGFEPNQNGQYQFRTLIMQGQFEMIIELNTDGSLNTILTDTTTSEVYVLHLTSQVHGQFVGQVAQAYQDVLYNIEQHCYDNDVFQSTPERKLIDGQHYLPGYHMNKKHWYSILLDDVVPLATIMDDVKVSYMLAK